MFKIGLIFLFCSLSLFVSRAQINLSENAQVSILTSEPSNQEVFTVFGHTAIRIVDSINRIDIVFNYGVFDFNSQYFIYNFAKGKTDYKLCIASFNDYIKEYKTRNSGVTEQVLNLNCNEKQKILDKLLKNSEPQNATYRYNFLYNNCATRPMEIINSSIDGNVIYVLNNKPQTFRELLTYFMRDKPWLIFGCDLVLGNKADAIATPQEKLFLPTYLKSALKNASIQKSIDNEYKMVVKTNMLVEEVYEKDRTIFLSPLFVSVLILIVLLVITIIELINKTWFKGIDFLLFLIMGLAGIIIFFMVFISEHPATNPNWIIIWLNPFHLLIPVTIFIKKSSNFVYYYNWINFLLLAFMLIFWKTFPQNFNLSNIPLVISLWLRSGSIIRQKPTRYSESLSNVITRIG